MVSSGRYRVVGANVFTHSEETILMLKTTSSVVKTMILGYNKTEDIFDLDADLHTSNITLLFMFIILYGFSSKEGPPSLVENSTVWLAQVCLLLWRLCSISQHWSPPHRSRQYSLLLIVYMQC